MSTVFETVPRLADVLSVLLAPYSADPDQEHRIAQYAPRYRLAFTLLNEDAAAGEFVTGWEMSDAIARKPFCLVLPNNS